MDANNHELRPSLAMLGVDSQHYNCIFVTFVFPNFLAVKVDLVLKMKLGGTWGGHYWNFRNHVR
jgi:hypothetical protein